MLATTCTDCPRPLDTYPTATARRVRTDAGSAAACGLNVRAALWPPPRSDRASLDYARGFLRRQSAAIIAGDQAALDALVVEADAYFAAIGD
jgi:hypothetical protein